jgi:hypothetical protein
MRRVTRPSSKNTGTGARRFLPVTQDAGGLASGTPEQWSHAMGYWLACTVRIVPMPSAVNVAPAR